MKAKPTLRHFLATIGSTLLAVSFAYAVDTDGTWTKNATGTQNWSDPLNWSGGNVADGIGYSAYLSDVITDNRTITLDTARTIGNIYAQDASHNYTISGANTLTLDASSGQSILNVVTSGRTLTIGTAVTVNDGIEKTGAGALAFSGPITLGGAQTWTNNSAGTLTTGSGTNLITNGGNQLTVDGTGTTTFGTINNAAVTLTGSGALVKNGSGRLNIGGLNSGFTGAVTINGGVLHAYNDAGALGNGNVTLNGGVLSFYWGVTYTRTLGTGTGAVQILGGESGFAGSGTTGPSISLGTSVTWGSTHFNPGKFVLGDSQTGNAAVTTFSSGIVLNGGTRTILVPKGTSSAGNTSTISGAITNGTGTSSLIKEGDGRLTVSAASTWNGSLTLSGGYLLFSNNSTSWGGTTTVNGGFLDMGGLNLANIGGGSGRNITVASGAAIRFGTLSNAILNRIVETTAEIGVMTGGTGNSFDFSSSTGANLPNAFLGNWAGNGAKAEMSGTITPGSNGYKFGAIGSSGLLGIRGVLSGANDLTVGQTGSSGIRVNIVATNTHSGETVINTGSKLTLGNNLALQNSALNVGAAGGNFALAAGTNTGRITGETAAASPTFGGLIGSRNLSSVFTTSAGNNETNLTANLVTGFTLNVASGNTFTYSGNIGGFGTGTSNNNGGGINGNSTLTKTGLGTQILSGTSTYTGQTLVSQGKLIINGAVASTSVEVNAYLGGSGVMANATLSGSGSINPGNSPGIMTASATDPTSGLDYNFEFTAANTAPTYGNATASVNDVLRLTNATPFTANLDSANIITLYLNVGSLTEGDVFTGGFYTDNNAAFLTAISSATFQYFLADAGGLTTYEGNTYTAYAGPLTFGVGTVAQTANFGSGDVTGYVTQFTVVPEPRAALLGGLGLLMLFRRRR
jgi:autotransporter-associated beta strand protein